MSERAARPIAVSPFVLFSRVILRAGIGGAALIVVYVER